MFEQVKLDYAFAALEPYIDALTMETHYSKHHATYTKNFNAAVEAAGIAGKSAEQILSSLGEVKDEASRKALRNNGGGYYNHNLYFEIMSPEKHSAPEGKLAAAIEKQFGSVEALKESSRRWRSGSSVPAGHGSRPTRTESFRFLRAQTRITLSWRARALSRFSASTSGSTLTT